jgi:hypothetical protein
VSSAGEWLIDKSRPLDEADLDALDRELADVGTSRGGRALPTLAVTLHDVIVHDNRSWFGGADIRLDAIVITGCGKPNNPSKPKDPTSYYSPNTFRFSRVKGGATLGIGSGGLRVFQGKVAHFLDIAITVSRDRKDTDDLAVLLTDKLRSKETQDAISPMLALATGTPTIAVFNAALAAAGVLGEIAYRALKVATGGDTIGIYRNSHLQVRDGFGIGPQPGPAKQSLRVQDFSFRYEISREK